MSKHVNGSDLRGAASLTIDGINGIIALVEAVHHSINRLGGLFGKSNQNRTTGITGMVYSYLRSVSGLAGNGTDLLLKRLSPLLGKTGSSMEREIVLSVLNGVLGDHLATRKNPLAIPMQFRRNGAPLTMDTQSLSDLLRQFDGKIVIMVHGSCMNDLEWNKHGHDHGAALASDLGYLPIYLHYNTGRHISQNGIEFAHLIEKFTGQFSHLKKLVIIAHSMGGLVSRSACYYGKLANHSWLNHLQKIVFLGTPHLGAPLERVGNWIDILLDISPYSAPFSRLGKIRSAGITDLRYGYILDEDWKGHDRFKSSRKQGSHVPLPEDVQSYTIAATTCKESSKLDDLLVGDGLVPLNSALGQHKDDELTLLFPKTHQKIVRNVNHVDLLDQSEVYETIKHWLTNK